MGKREEKSEMQLVVVSFGSFDCFFHAALVTGHLRRVPSGCVCVCVCMSAVPVHLSGMANCAHLFFLCPVGGKNCHRQARVLLLDCTTWVVMSLL